MLNFKANKNQLFSVIKNHKLYQLLNKDLSKSKFFRSKFSIEENLSFLNKYELIVNCDPFNFITKVILVKNIQRIQ